MLDMEERCKSVAVYMLEHQCTVRQAAKEFNISKSTVHKDVHERLPTVDPILYNRVKKLLDRNKAERHIRGGWATKAKYSKKK